MSQSRTLAERSQVRANQGQSVAVELGVLRAEFGRSLCNTEVAPTAPESAPVLLLWRAAMNQSPSLVLDSPRGIPVRASLGLITIRRRQKGQYGAEKRSFQVCRRAAQLVLSRLK